MYTIKLAIVDDSIALQKTLVNAFKVESTIQVVIIANNGVDLFAKLKVLTSFPDIVLMDVHMPQMDGIEATLLLGTAYPQVKVIALTQFDNEENIIKMYASGVKGFIAKGVGFEEVLKAITIVYDGGVYMTEKVLLILKERYFDQNFSADVQLTEFEKLLLDNICNGKSSTEIGKMFFKSPRTIEDYRLRLYKKFQVNSKDELIKAAVKMKFV